MLISLKFKRNWLKIENPERKDWILMNLYITWEEKRGRTRGAMSRKSVFVFTVIRRIREKLCLNWIKRWVSKNTLVSRERNVEEERECSEEIKKGETEELWSDTKRRRCGGSGGFSHRRKDLWLKEEIFIWVCALMHLKVRNFSRFYWFKSFTDKLKWLINKVKIAILFKFGVWILIL